MKELDMNVNLRLYGRVTNLIINHKKSRNEAVSYYKCDLCEYKTTQHSNVHKNQSMKELDIVVTNVNIKLHNIVV